MTVEYLLFLVAALLFMIFWKLDRINARLKERFPTEKEQDYEWSQKDPIGHAEAHQYKSGKK